MPLKLIALLRVPLGTFANEFYSAGHFSDMQHTRDEYHGQALIERRFDGADGDLAHAKKVKHVAQQGYRVENTVGGEYIHQNRFYG